MSRANRQIWEDVFEAFRRREHPLVYKPESDGAIFCFCIIVLGRMALDCGTFIGYIGGQVHRLYEDWDPLYGGRSSWDINHAVVREPVARVGTNHELV